MKVFDFLILKALLKGPVLSQLDLPVKASISSSKS